jgi:hypothetical protein
MLRTYVLFFEEFSAALRAIWNQLCPVLVTYTTENSLGSIRSPRSGFR